MAGISKEDIERFKRVLNRPLAGWLDRVYEVEFQQLELHRLFVDEHLGAAKARLEAEFQKTYDELDSSQQDVYADFMVDEVQMLTETLPTVQWQAQFLVVYATFENSLNSLCNVAKRRLKSDLSLKDMTGQGIERAKLYLSKVAGVTGVFDSPLWHYATHLGKIRNLIAHAQGRIDEAVGAQSVAALRKLNGLELKPVTEGSTEYRLLLSAMFVADSISELQKLVRAVAMFERDWPDTA